MTVQAKKSRDQIITNHRLVVEGESLHRTEGARGAGYVPKHHKSLAPHFQCLQSNNIENLAKL